MRSGSGAAGWVIGLALGIILAILLAVGGSLGLLAIVAAIAGGWRVGHSLAFEPGLLAGIGGTWLALLARVAWECPNSDQSGPCFVPDQTPWVLIFMGVTGVGVVLGGLALRQRARTSLQRP